MKGMYVCQKPLKCFLARFCALEKTDAFPLHSLNALHLFQQSMSTSLHSPQPSQCEWVEPVQPWDPYFFLGCGLRHYL